MQLRLRTLLGGYKPVEFIALSVAPTKIVSACNIFGNISANTHL
ncbi:hypothetical protein T03_10176 [Trichinella britovi]|uniref:Uncharacterized protein n=1 Tax=Trichinella britovi TaxID=45882 RepID=A0A0V1BCB3_TRIBR|nr:hypothetical protein T03_9843 [Trichinella britovi]KRY34590.1 hypothetical protein T03_10176 [Trichinella britovi]